MPRVTIPGVGAVTFPYDMSPEQISAAAKKLYDDEQNFRDWYAVQAEQQQLDPNPDDPRHHYDYRAAFKAGAGPGPDGHWPSQFKAPDHANRFVDGVDTITGEPVKTPGLFKTAISTLGRTTGLGPLPGGEMGELASRAMQPENLSSTGGAVGGLTAGPGGAAAGGAAGSALASGMRRAEDALSTGKEPTFEDLVGDLGTAAVEGGTQGAMQVAGGMAARVPGMASRGLARASEAMAGPAGKTVRRFLTRTGTPIGIGAAVAHPAAAIGTLAATGAANVVTSPKALMAASHAVGRIPAGTGQVPANLLRAALLQALGGDEPQPEQP